MKLNPDNNRPKRHSQMQLSDLAEVQSHWLRCRMFIVGPYITTRNQQLKVLSGFLPDTMMYKLCNEQQKL
eukprot:scaffold276438_cov37-Prasinocladus_malaysianus.AAC.1